MTKNVLEEILKAYAAGEQLPSPEAIRELAGAAAKSEQVVINEYARVYRSAWLSSNVCKGVESGHSLKAP